MSVNSEHLARCAYLQALHPEKSTEGAVARLSHGAQDVVQLSLLGHLSRQKYV